MIEMSQIPKRFDEREAAEYLGLAHITVKKLRLARRGPSHFRLGKRVVYSEQDLSEWMNRRRVETSEQPVSA